MPRLIMLSGPSGSGKSTLAKELMEADGNLIRLNRDKLREMSILKWTPKREGWIIDAELALATAASHSKKNILIDDTNLMPSDEDRWKNKAKELGYTFEKKVLETDLQTCILRDESRVGNARIGRPAIERQFLRAKLWKIPEGKKTVIFDIDGTLAEISHRVPWINVGGTCPACKGTGKYCCGSLATEKCPSCTYCAGTGKLQKKYHDMFYSLVHLDTPVESVVKWIRACYEEYHVLIVSGRSPEKSGDGTINWLFNQSIPYHHIIMRRANHHGPDDEEKQLILDDILKIIPKEQIAFVVDDRPSVVAMWRRNGLKVYPVKARDDAEFYKQMDELEINHPQLKSETV